MVLCYVEKCGYYDRQHCRNRLPVVNENGMCKYAWIKRNGQFIPNPRLEEPIEEEFKKELYIEDVEFKEVAEEQEKREDECAGNGSDAAEGSVNVKTSGSEGESNVGLDVQSESAET